MNKTVIQVEELSAEELLHKLNTIERYLEVLHEKLQPQSAVELMSRQEVADFFQVSLVTVHDWLNKGWLRSHRIGNKVRFKRHEVEEALVEIHRKRK